MLESVGISLPSFPGARCALAWRQLGCAAVLAVVLMSCGSEAQLKRNNDAMDEQLAAANTSIAEREARETNAPIGSADEAGQQMRTSSAKPPRP